MRRESADTLAVQALGWLAGSDELLPVFLGATGATLADLRAGAEDPAFLAAVLDFVMMDDAWVIAFCHAADVPPADIARARALLPGGEAVHWT